MARDEEEEERELLADLEGRTGRDLAAWMAAIAAEGSPTRTRPSTGCARRASRLPAPPGSSASTATAAGRSICTSRRRQPASPGQPDPAQAGAAPRRPSQREIADLDKLLAAGKGYRPLYQLLEAEIRDAVPGLVVTPKAGYISLGAPREFAAVTLHATELRLGLDLGDRAFDAPLQKPKLKGPGPAISHMLVITDARQVNAELLNLIKARMPGSTAEAAFGNHSQTRK